jgi:serine protease inhibitor
MEESLMANAAADTNTVAKPVNQLALKLYSCLAGTEENAVFSPLSLASALAMVYAGARGSTAKEMAEVLAFPTNAEDLARGFARCHTKQGTVQGRQGLHICNALWVQNGLPILPDYFLLLRDQFRAALFAPDFAADKEGARTAINNWARQECGGKISELLAPDALSDATRLVLTNTVDFVAKWHAPFDANDTVDGPFYPEAGAPVQAPLMRVDGRFGYCEQEAYTLLELPYAGGAFSFLVLLPKERGGLRAVEGALTNKELTGSVSALESRPVSVCLPRFCIALHLDLAESLQGIGLDGLFSGCPDLSGMSGAPDLRVESVIHAAQVEVGEAGTEAAAATAVIDCVTACLPARECVGFIADHPFLFAIRECSSGVLAFVGRCGCP